MQAYGKWKRLTGSFGDNTGEFMASERKKYLQEECMSGNKCNGYRPGRTYILPAISLTRYF